MARNNKGAPSSRSGDDTEEMTVIVVKVKGQGDTLRKGFDAISNAFASISSAPLPARRQLAAGLSQPNGSGTVEQPLGQGDEDDEIEEEDAVAESSAAATPRPRKYKFLDDFDLSAGAVPWKEFAASKDPKTDNDRYLVAALWITENAGVATFNIAHVFTCFRAMQWNEQKDFSQPMRFMKSKKSYFDNPSRKTWKLTQVGLEAARAIVASGA